MAGHFSNTYRRSDVNLLKDDDLYSSTSSRGMTSNRSYSGKLTTYARVSSQPNFLRASSSGTVDAPYVPKLGEPPEVLRPDGEYHRPSSLTPSSPTLSMTPDLGEDTMPGVEEPRDNFAEHPTSIGHISVQGYRSPGRTTSYDSLPPALREVNSRTALMPKPSMTTLQNKVQQTITELRERSPNVKSPESSPRLSPKGKLFT